MEFLPGEENGGPVIILISKSEKDLMMKIVEKYGDFCTDEDVQEILQENKGGLSATVEILQALRYPDSHMKELGIEDTFDNRTLLKAAGTLLEDVVKEPLHLAEDMEEFLHEILNTNVVMTKGLFEFKVVETKPPESTQRSI